MDAFSDKKEELQKLEEDDGGASRERPDEVFKTSPSQLWAVALTHLSFKHSYKLKSPVAPTSPLQKGGTREEGWGAWPFLSAAAPTPAAPVTAVTTWQGPSGCWCSSQCSCTVCQELKEGGGEEKKIYFYPDPCTDSPNGPTSSIGITGRVKRRGRALPTGRSLLLAVWPMAGSGGRGRWTGPVHLSEHYLKWLS